MRWLVVTWKLFLSRFMCIDSFCKKCGCDVRDFHVDSDTWALVEPHIKRGHVLCYNCFSDVCGNIGLSRVWRLEPLD